MNTSTVVFITIVVGLLVFAMGWIIGSIRGELAGRRAVYEELRRQGQDEIIADVKEHLDGP